MLLFFCIFLSNKYSLVAFEIHLKNIYTCVCLDFYGIILLYIYFQIIFCKIFFIYIYMCVYVCVCVCMYVCMYICVCIYIYKLF